MTTSPEARRLMSVAAQSYWAKQRKVRAALAEAGIARKSNGNRNNRIGKVQRAQPRNDG